MRTESGPEQPGSGTDPQGSSSTAPPVLEETPAPTWQKIAAACYVAAAAVLLVAFRGRLGADFWPPDAARVAPNILATLIQIAIATPAAVLLWPPTRRRVHRFVDRHTAPLHAHLEAAQAQRERHHQEHLAQVAANHAEQMAKLDEIHAHVKEGG